LSNRQEKQVLLSLLIDAFPKTYLSEKHTPFLHSLTKDGVLTHIEPLFAFKGIETTLFTGLWPNVHNVWTEFCLSDNRVGGKNNTIFRSTIKVLDRLPLGESKSKARYVFEKFVFRRSPKIPNLIPPEATSFFQASQRKPITEPGVVGDKKTVFDNFREKGLRYVFIEPSISGDKGVVRQAKKLICTDPNIDYWYIKLNHLDHMGHRYGPAPSLFSKQLETIDAFVEQIVLLLQRENPNLNVLIMSDHGMSKVSKTINILGDLKFLKSRLYKDYVAFVDSTMIRFWFFSQEAKIEVCEHMNQLEHGHILSLSEKENLKTPIDQKYGQTIFVMDEGYIVSPCFFHSKSVRGMHGYAYPRTFDAQPILILNNALAKNYRLPKQPTFADIAQLISIVYS